MKTLFLLFSLLISLSVFAQEYGKETDEVPKKMEMPKFEKLKMPGPAEGAIKFTCKDGEIEYKPTDKGYEDCVSKVQGEISNDPQKKKTKTN